MFIRISDQKLYHQSQQHIYKLKPTITIGGDDQHEFYIGRDNGNVLLAKNLDWETRREYNLTISITDGVHIVTTQLYITVLGKILKSIMSL